MSHKLAILVLQRSPAAAHCCLAQPQASPKMEPPSHVCQPLPPRLSLSHQLEFAFAVLFLAPSLPLL